MEKEETKVETTNEVKEENKKSKKGLVIALIVIGALLLLSLIGTGLFFAFKYDLFRNNNKPVEKNNITITFDSDGGTKVKSITFKRQTMVELPKSTKEGYEFEGWFITKLNGNSKEYYSVGDELTNYWTKMLSDNITVQAKWKNLSIEGMTIYFDAKGGKIAGNNSNDSQSLVSCKEGVYVVEGLPTATKDGYNFMAWTDKNGTPILNGASLICEEELKLYATWEKKEEPKTAKCPSGYELKDNKCVTTVEGTKYCEDGWTLVKGDCVNPKSPNPKGTRTCPEKTYGGWTGTGTYYEAGRGYCGYYELTSYIGQRDNCRNAGGSLASNNHCYKYVEPTYTITCAPNEKKFGDQEIAPGNGGGCYQVSNSKVKCPDGYQNSADFGKCDKIIDPIYE